MSEKSFEGTGFASFRSKLSLGHPPVRPPQLFDLKIRFSCQGHIKRDPMALTDFRSRSDFTFLFTLSCPRFSMINLTF